MIHLDSHIQIGKRLKALRATTTLTQKAIGEPGIQLWPGMCLLHCYLASATTATYCTGDLTIMEK